MSQDYDLAIVGGGLVGASLAVALADSPLRVVLIEAAAPPVGVPAWDERCIALNDASRRIFGGYGVWDALRSEAAPITATHISERGRFGTTRFSAAEAGLQALGYNVPLRAIGAALLQRMAALPRLELLQPARLVAIEPPGADAVMLSVDAGGAMRRIGARLVVAADGARSAVRELLGISAEQRDYEQHAIVSAVRSSRPHQGVAYERFTPEGPIALIPKPEDAASLVWTVPQARVQERLALDDAAYLAQAQDCFGGRLGRFTALGRRWSFPLARVLSGTLTAPRTVFIGNAAQSLHPVAAQGFNLGLRDVATLAGLLAAAPDPGAAELLAEYAARRERDRNRVAGLTDLMVRAFSNRVPVLSQARHWGLVAVELAAPLREAVLRQHLGQLGLPRSAVGSSLGEEG
ncbi:MAG: 2-octaprenyl-6-methoxyphenyl hydroxylase [Nevskia sp.]|nr:2-octaprenyl-6-methoxyphenyl hydroxylase [Nevskia sp.]